MFGHDLTRQQIICNKANARIDFTYPIDQDYHYLGRYVVADECFYLGKNPSMQYDLIVTIGDMLKKDADSIGGWLNPDTEDYELNTNKHFHDLNDAIDFAKEREQRYIYDAVTRVNIKVFE